MSAMLTPQQAPSVGKPSAARSMAKLSAAVATEPSATMMSEPSVEATDKVSRPCSRRGRGCADGFIAAVKGSLLLRHLSTAELKFVATNVRVATFEPGSVVYEMGSEPENFYIVQMGRFSETGPHPSGGQRPRRIHEGTGVAFGAHELLFGVPRKTTISVALDADDQRGTSAAAACWAIPKRVFETKIRLAPAPDGELLAFLQRLPLFVKLCKAELVQLARAARPLHLNASSIVCTQGEAANTLYVLRRGAVEAHQAGVAEAFVMQAPMVFGESALSSDEGMRIRQATVRCCAGGGSALVIAFDAAEIETLLGFGLQARAEHAFHQKLLEQIKVAGRPIISTLPASQRTWLVDQVVERTYAPLQVVCQQGSSADMVYIVKRGTASIGTKEGGKLAEVGPGTVLGEIALCDLSATRNATVVASEDGGELTMLCLSGAVVQQNANLGKWREGLEGLLGAHRKQQARDNKAAVAEKWRLRKVASAPPARRSPSTVGAQPEAGVLPHRTLRDSTGPACATTNMEMLKSLMASGARRQSSQQVSSAQAARNGQRLLAAATGTVSSDASSPSTRSPSPPLGNQHGSQALGRHISSSSGGSRSSSPSFRRAADARSCISSIRLTPLILPTPPTPAPRQLPPRAPAEPVAEDAMREVAELRDLFASGPPTLR